MAVDYTTFFAKFPDDSVNLCGRSIDFLRCQRIKHVPHKCAVAVNALDAVEYTVYDNLDHFVQHINFLAAVTEIRDRLFGN